MGSGPSKAENNNTVNETTTQSVTDSSEQGDEVIPEEKGEILKYVKQDEHFDSREETLLDVSEHLTHLYPKEEDSSIGNIKEVSDFSEESIHLPNDKSNQSEEESDISVEKEVEDVLNDTKDLEDLQDGPASQRLKKLKKTNGVKLSVHASPVRGYLGDSAGNSLDTLISEEMRKDPAREYSEGRVITSSSDEFNSPRSQGHSVRSSWSDREVKPETMATKEYKIDRNSEEWVLSKVCL